MLTSAMRSLLASETRFTSVAAISSASLETTCGFSPFAKSATSGLVFSLSLKRW